MLVSNLKKHRTDGGCFWRFQIEVNAGGGVLKLLGWRYYAASRRLRPPAGRTTQKGWVSFSGSDEACRNSIRRLVESQIEARELDALSNARKESQNQ